MFYVFLVGLAKLHCGATPPPVMVLCIVCPLKEQFLRIVTFGIFDQGDEETKLLLKD